jgi:hypothetical protein
VLKEANTEQAIAVRDLVMPGAAPWSLSSGAPESGLSCHRAPQPPERHASKVTATTIPIKIRRFATKSCSRIGLAWRLAPAEMDHPDADNADHSRDPALDEDSHRAHRDDVDCDHDYDADDQPRRRYGLTLDCQFKGNRQSTGAARAELGEEPSRG